MAYIGSTPSTGPVNTAPGNSSNGDANTVAAPSSEPHSFYWTDGWYVTIACVGGILVANTKIGPVWYSILGVALIYQLNLLLQGK